jgi:hypothetical protein
MTPTTTKEKTMTSRDQWRAATRASVLRALNTYGVPVSAAVLVDDLDVVSYFHSVGFVGRRTQREVSAALAALESIGAARRVPESERDADDPPGVLYEPTPYGYTRAEREACRTAEQLEARGYRLSATKIGPSTVYFLRAIDDDARFATKAHQHEELEQ